jgi:hypothetical protein
MDVADFLKAVFSLHRLRKTQIVVIPSEARNLSWFKTQEKRDSSARSVPRNDNGLSFSGFCSVEGIRGLRQTSRFFQGGFELLPIFHHLF